MKHKILVVVDAQNDFIDGSLANKEAQERVGNIAKKIDDFDGDLIFVTRDTHDANYLETNEGKKLPVVHCVKDTEGWLINRGVSEALMKKDLSESNVVTYVNKPTFGSPELANQIRKLDGDLEVELVGFCTDICVVSNALLIKSAVYDRARVVVDASCCAGVTPESHKAALTTMKMCQIDVE